MKKKLLSSLGPILGASLFAGALWIIHHALAKYQYHDILRHLEELPRERLVLALVLTMVNYMILTGYDTLSIRYIKETLSYGKIAFVSFIAYAFSQSLGFGWLTGGGIRFRLYSAWGLSAVEITNVVAFNGLTFWLGYMTLAGVVFLFVPIPIPAGVVFPFLSLRPVGILLLLVVLAYLLWVLVIKRPLRFRSWEFAVPPLKLLVFQLLLPCLDWAVAGSVLFVLFSPIGHFSYPTFLAIFLLAQIVGLISHVPAGLGVFETVMLLFLTPALSPAEVLGILLGYRGIYYLIPLTVAALLLGGHELLQERGAFRWFGRLFGQWAPALVPQVLAFTTFLSGAILLFSGATPTVSSRLAWLRDFLPLPVVELSHLLGSVAGVLLLLLARGLQRRLDAAYVLAAVLLAAGIVFSLLKGLDYEEALILSIMLWALLPSRRHFYRKTSLIGEAFSAGWIAAIALVLVCSIWLGIFSYKHVDYSGDLWWRFAFRADAPRFLRASVGAVGVALIFGLARLLRPAPPKILLPDAEELAKARAVVEKSPDPAANLALLGDKTLLFSHSGKSLLMYGVEGRSWVSLGDPVGEAVEIAELVWQFRALADQHAGWTVFYEVKPQNLTLYLDQGLSLLKLGEEARVRLETFTLEGGPRKNMRNLHNRLSKEGCTFELVPASEVAPLLPELQGISDAWLAEKNTREKGFSLGFFSPEYLTLFPVALVRMEGKVVAFANLWLGAEKEEVSPDLMRYLPLAPTGVMEYLFLELMLWGKREEYQWFNLGMAPLSGLENRELAPLWNRVGALIFKYGEQFYNFQGLREYKDRFFPEWEPRYLASPGGLTLPRILTDVAALISGGLKGVFAK